MKKVKNLKQWKKSGKDLDEFLSPGDWISEDLCNYIGEIIPSLLLLSRLSPGRRCREIRIRGTILLYVSQNRG